MTSETMIPSGRATSCEPHRVRIAVIATLSIALVMILVASVVRPTEARAETVTVGSTTGFSPGGGFMWLNDSELTQDLDAMAASGAQWLRLDFPWGAVEQSRGVFTWGAVDRVVNAAAARGIKVLALPAYTPAWARPVGTTDKYPPTNVADFAVFVKAAATRYSADRVQAWEIWNEPNISNFWAPAPDPVKYASMLKSASAALRSVRPGVPVISGGLSPATDSATTLSPSTFLNEVYAQGAASSFDAVGMHPYSFPALPMDPSTSSWNTYYRLPLIRDLMVTRGDGAKKIWLTEVGAPTGSASDAVTEQRQSDIVAQSISQSQSWAWTGPLFVYSLRDIGTDPYDREQNFGLLRLNRSPKLGWEPFRSAVAKPSSKTVDVVPTPATTTTTAPAPTTTTTTAPAPTTTTTTTAPAPTTTTTTAPARTAPTGVAVRKSRRDIAVSWKTGSDAFVAGYRVYRRIDLGNWGLLASTEQMTYLDTQPSAGSTHSYYVTAILSDGFESMGSEVVVYTLNGRKA